MTEFYVVALALILLAGLFVLFPVLQPKPSATASRKAANIQLFKERQQELDELLANGTMEQAQYDTLSVELQRRVLEEAEQEPDVSTDTNQGRPGAKHWPAALAITLVMGVAAVLLYQSIGYQPDWAITQTLESARSKVAAGEKADAERLELLERLQARLQQRPDEPFYWMLKGNVEMEMARLQESVDSFEALLALVPEDTSVMAKLLEARYLRDRGQLDAQSQALAAQILQRDPNNVRTLGLLGIHSFESRRYAQAIAYWQKLLPLVGPFSPNGKMISQGIERAKTLLAEQGGELPEKDAADGPTLQVAVSLGEQISVDKSASVFVYARAANGPRMPLAVQRLTVADLPARVTLDDSMAMAPGMNLSSVQQVEVVARISKQGIANPGSGDIEGVRGPISLQQLSEPVSVVIDQVLP